MGIKSIGTEMKSKIQRQFLRNLSILMECRGFALVIPGNLNLSRASLSFVEKNRAVDAKPFDFELRDVTSFWTREVYKEILIIGKKILIRRNGLDSNAFINVKVTPLEFPLNYS